MKKLNDLDRFISGQIGFEEIQGQVKEGVYIQDAIIGGLSPKCPSKLEHDLYEKFCYATVLYRMRFYSPSSLYSESRKRSKLSAQVRLGSFVEKDRNRIQYG